MDEKLPPPVVPEVLSTTTPASEVPVVPAKKGYRTWILVGLTLLVLIGLIVAGFYFRNSIALLMPKVHMGQLQQEDGAPAVIKLPGARAGVFAQYSEKEVAVTPALAEYTLTLSELVNLTAIEAAEQQPFTSEQRLAMTNNHFTIGKAELRYSADTEEIYSTMHSGRIDDMVDLYVDYGGSGAPWERKPENAVFVTSDLLLHIYHSFIDKIFQNIEQEKFHPTLRALSTDLYSRALAQAETSTDELMKTKWERVAAFFLVPRVILETSHTQLGTFDPEERQQQEEADTNADSWEKALQNINTYESKLSSTVFEKAKKELEYIFKADGLYPSPLYDEFRSKIGLSNPEDYSQYTPRSHYTKNSLLRSYFRAMMWYGRQGFVAKSDYLTREAAMITYLLTTQPPNQAGIEAWESIYLPTVFFVGRSDDLSVYEYGQAVQEVFGEAPQPQDFANPEKLVALGEKVKSMPGPSILSDAFIGDGVFDATKEGLLAETKAFRFMGQRFIPDSYMFTRLTQGNEKLTSEIGQKLPSTPTALMIMELLGSETAKTELATWIKTEAPESDKAIPLVLNQLKTEFDQLQPSDWTQNIYWTWLYTLKSLFVPVPSGYPVFMSRPAWGYKNLHTALGSWTELRHDTLLYAKQSYAELGGGGEPPTPPPVPKGYVEPNIDFFKRLQALVSMTMEGLNSRDLLHPLYAERLKTFATILDFLQKLAVQELENTMISDDDYERLRKIGNEFRPLLSPIDADMITEKNARAAIIADVHTDVPNNQILYEATGIPYEIYVAVKDQGGTRLTRGVIFSHYEFTRPLGQRLTDEEWQSWVYGDTVSVPQEPAWTKPLFTP